jgi:hypothetical protein
MSTKPKRTPGGQANANGRVAEDVILGIIQHRGYAPITQYAIGLGIYGAPLRVDLYIPDIPSYPNGLIIESKWQELSGSADEKLPYLVENIQRCYPCPTIIVLHGGGFRPGAERWLRSQVGGNLIHVLRLEEFVTWSNRNL